MTEYRVVFPRSIIPPLHYSSILRLRGTERSGAKFTQKETMERILALRTKGLARPSIHDGMVRAFRALGIYVLDLPVPNNSNHLRSLLDLAKSGGSQAIFTLDLGADDLFIEHLREIQLSLGIPLIVWFVDDPEGYGFPGSCERHWTLAFCWDRQIVNEGCSEAGWSLFHLPLATDPRMFYPERERDPYGSYGGVFVGSVAHENPLLERIAETTPGFADDVETIWRAYQTNLSRSLRDLTWQFAAGKAQRPLGAIQTDPMWRFWVHACLFKLGIKKRHTLVSRILGRRGRIFGDEAWLSALPKKLYGGRVAYGHEVRTIYNGSAFVLETRQPQAHTGLTQRIFDGAACGVPVIAEWSPEVDALLEPRTECLCFHTLEEGIEQRRLFLRYPREAEKIGERALRRVLAHHTYAHRARQILDTFHRFF